MSAARSTVRTTLGGHARDRRIAAVWARPLARRRGGPRVFATPDEAARVLIDTVKANDLEGLVALFGAPGQDLVDTSDAATGRRNREVFVAAVAEGWRLGGPRPRPQGAGPRQRGLAVPGAARQGSRGVVVRRGGRPRGGPEPPHRAQRAGRHPRPARLRRGAARLRRHRPRRQARGAVRAPLRQRPGPAERALLAGAARRAAQSARSPRRAGLGAGLPAPAAKGRPRSTATTSASSRARARPRRAALPSTSSMAR